MESENPKKFKLKRASEMKKLSQFTKEELDKINQVKHIENEDENSQKIKDLKVK
jgi:hypothetical protein